MYFSVNASIPTTLASVWHTYTRLLDVGFYCLLTWIVMKLVMFFVALPPDWATGHNKSTICGKMNSVEYSSIVPQFHPNAPAGPQGIRLFDVLSRFLDGALKQMTAFGSSLFETMPMAEILRRLADIESVRGPINTRLNRGIAQISALRKGAAAHRSTIFRYLCPTIFSCFVLVGLIVIAGVSIEFTMLMYSGALVLIAAGDVGAGEEDESNFAPRRAEASVFATLFE